MPATLTYPGVYLEEVPSGVRPIAGVATSLAAFVGWAARGPTDRAVLVTSWSGFERQFGGLDARSLLGYAVYHFFNNGGSLAYIVRLVAVTDGGAGTTAPDTASVSLDGRLQVSARNPGAWANRLRVRLRTVDSTTDSANHRFRLAVVEVVDGREVEIEPFENVSMIATDARFVVNVLAEESQYITAAILGGATQPPADTPNGSSPGLGSTVPGADGSVLTPGTGPFHAALQAGGGTGGVRLLERVDLFNLLCVPGETDAATVGQLQAYARGRLAFVIADCAPAATFTTLEAGPGNVTGADAINAAFYFPWVNAPDPLQEGRPRAFPPCGF
ncbi:MAG TPA: phage tail sheath family protein, partial [Verrucomicrobiota bacterium]|nr:phage tail sheath family protein [Verrucomicrobiota bacterium]